MGSRRQNLLSCFRSDILGSFRDGTCSGVGGLQWRLLPVFWETPSTGWERLCLTLQGLKQNQPGRFSPLGGAIPAIQMHSNKSKGYPGPDGEGERTVFCTLGS